MTNTIIFYLKLINKVLFCTLGPGAPAAKYIGGEQRHDTAGKLAYINIATDCSSGNVKDILAGTLLASILGKKKQNYYRYEYFCFYCETRK